MRAKIKRMIGVVLAASILLTAGCGQPQDQSEDMKTGLETGEAGSTQGSEAGGETEGKDDQAMGRYVETIYPLPMELGGTAVIGKMEDGSLKLVDSINGLNVSKDNGATWEAGQAEFIEHIQSEDSYIMDIAVARDGSTAVIYVPAETEKQEGDDEFALHPDYMLVSPDGTQTKLTLPNGSDNYMSKFYFSQDGKLFGTTLDKKVYEVNAEEGTGTLLFESPSSINNMVVGKNRLVYCTGSGFKLYDLEKKEEVEDQALDEFTASAFGGIVNFSSEGTVPIAMMLEDDNILYLVCAKGIYRHVIGGSLMEQVVDGTICSLNNPTYGIMGAVYLENDSFLVLFTSGEVIHYTYDPNVKTVPDVQISAYSLEENDVLRQAISLYQSRHPEAYVKYEIGLDTGTTVTREDALKKLNTELMAGKGPDLLILDDMPMDSYMEKGVLQDLTPYLADSQKELLPGIFNSFKTDTGIFVLPVQFQLPLVVGDKTEIAGISNLASLADTVEKIRKEKSEGKIFGFISGEQVLAALLPVCAPVWKNGDGTINTDSIKEFLTETKRIWDTESAGLTPEMQERNKERVQNWNSSDYSREKMRNFFRSMNMQISGYQMGEQDFVLGTIASDWDAASLTSSFLLKGNENGDFAVLNGQADNVFVPNTIAGISAGSGQSEAAAELLDIMLNEPGISRSEGFPVNMASLKETFVNQYTDSNQLGAEGFSMDDGTSFSFDLYWPEESQIAQYMQLMEKVDTPYLPDTVLENAVFEAGIKVLDQEESVEDGVKEIVDKTAIYLAE